MAAAKAAAAVAESPPPPLSQPIPLSVPQPQPLLPNGVPASTPISQTPGPHTSRLDLHSPGLHANAHSRTVPEAAQQAGFDIGVSAALDSTQQTTAHKPWGWPEVRLSDSGSDADENAQPTAMEVDGGNAVSVPNGRERCENGIGAAGDNGSAKMSLEYFFPTAGKAGKSQVNGQGLAEANGSALEQCGESAA